MAESVVTNITDRSRRTAEGTGAHPEWVYDEPRSLSFHDTSTFIYDDGDIRRYGPAIGPRERLAFTQYPGGKAYRAWAVYSSFDELVYVVKHRFKFSVKHNGGAGPVIRLDELDFLWTDDAAWGGRLVKCAEMSCSRASRTWEIRLKVEDGDSTTLGDSGAVLWTTPDQLLLATRRFEDGRRGPLEDLMLLPVPRVTWKNSAGDKVAEEIWASEEHSTLCVVRKTDESIRMLVFAAWCARLWYYKYVHEPGDWVVENPTEKNEASAGLELASGKKERRKRSFRERLLPNRQGAKKGGKRDVES